MAAAGVIHGSSGRVEMTSPYDTGFNIFMWTANVVNDEYPADLFEDAASPGELGHIFYYGLHQLRGKIRGYLDSAVNLDATQIVPARTPADFDLIAVQGVAAVNDMKLIFKGHLNNFAIVVNAQTGLNAVEADIVSTGAVTVQNLT